MAGTSYSIGSSTRRCAATDRELVTGEPYVAVLAQQADSDDFERFDFAAEAWDSGARPPRSSVVLGFWRGSVPDPSAKRRMLVDDQSLLELFERSAEAIEPADLGEGAQPSEGDHVAKEKQRLAFRFVLALILLRKRLLVQDDSRGSTMLVRVRTNKNVPLAPRVEVVDPGLDDATLIAVTEKLGAVIAGDAPAPAASKAGARA